MLVPHVVSNTYEVEDIAKLTSLTYVLEVETYWFLALGYISTCDSNAQSHCSENTFAHIKR